MRAIHRDEIQHVAFGVHWLRRLKLPGQSEWEAYESSLRNGRCVPRNRAASRFIVSRGWPPECRRSSSIA